MASLSIIILMVFCFINLFAVILELPHFLSIVIKDGYIWTSIIIYAILTGIAFFFLKKQHNFNSEEAKGLISTTEEIIRSFDATKVRRQYVSTFSKIINNQIKTNDKFIFHNKSFEELDQIKLLVQKTEKLKIISENIK